MLIIFIEKLLVDEIVIGLFVTTFAKERII